MIDNAPPADTIPLADVPTPPATNTPVPTSAGLGCDPSYPDVCIAPAPPDLDCGEIPHQQFRVIGADPHGFDGDGDGIGCEGDPAPQAPTPIPPTAVPPTPIPTIQQAVCDCSGNVYNCSDFSTHNQAQACMNYCIAQGRGDIHRLDGDYDGVACESLP